jgi:hypothetical protein
LVAVLIGQMAGKGDAVVVSRRFIQSRALFAAAATSLAAVGMILSAATALADDADSGDSKPLPGTAIIRSADRGVAQAGPSTVTGAPKGTAWGDGDDASKGAPILIHDGNQSPLCFANAEFDNAACGLG